MLMLQTVLIIGGLIAGCFTLAGKCNAGVGIILLACAIGLLVLPK